MLNGEINIAYLQYCNNENLIGITYILKMKKMGGGLLNCNENNIHNAKNPCSKNILFYALHRLHMRENVFDGP